MLFRCHCRAHVSWGAGRCRGHPRCTLQGERPKNKAPQSKKTSTAKQKDKDIYFIYIYIFFLISINIFARNRRDLWHWLWHIFSHSTVFRYSQDGGRQACLFNLFEFCFVPWEVRAPAGELALAGRRLSLSILHLPLWKLSGKEFRVSRVQKEHRTNRIRFCSAFCLQMTISFVDFYISSTTTASLTESPVMTSVEKTLGIY